MDQIEIEDDATHQMVVKFCFLGMNTQLKSKSNGAK